jgi:hypothetical protein
VENAACNPQGYAQNLWIYRYVLKKSEPIELSSMSDKLFLSLKATVPFGKLHVEGNKNHWQFPRGATFERHIAARVMQHVARSGIDGRSRPVAVLRVRF